MKEQKHSSFNDFAEKINNKLTDENSWIILSILIICYLLYFVVDALTAKPNSDDYYNAHLYLFIMICMVYSGSLFVPGVAKQMFDTFRKFLKNRKKLTKIDIFFNLLLCGNVLASVSFLIVDFSFFRSRGLRIPIVVAINLFGIFKSYFTRGK